MAKLCNGTGSDKDATDFLSGIQDILYPKNINRIADSLARTARFFYRELCYIGYYVLVWLSGPPKV